MNEFDWVELAIKLALLHFGMLTHFGRKVLAAKMYKSEREVCITGYWKKYPIQTVLTISGAYAGMLLFYGTPEMTRSMAFALGYMADNIADAVSHKQMKVVKGE